MSVPIVDAKRLLWKRLIELEPRLEQVYAAAASIKDNRGAPYFCANEAWSVWLNRGSVWARWPNKHGITLKQWPSMLVGWDRYDNDPVLSTSKSYECAYQTVYEALPACCNCGCVQVGGRT